MSKRLLSLYIYIHITTHILALNIRLIAIYLYTYNDPYSTTQYHYNKLVHTLDVLLIPPL